MELLPHTGAVDLALFAVLCLLATRTGQQEQPSSLPGNPIWVRGLCLVLLCIGSWWLMTGDPSLRGMSNCEQASSLY